MRRVHNERSIERNAATVDGEFLAALYEHLQGKWKVHTFEVGDYEIESADEAAALPKSFIGDQGRICFSASEPFVAFRRDNRGHCTAYIRDDLHHPSLRFLSMCEAMFSGSTVTRTNLARNLPTTSHVPALPTVPSAPTTTAPAAPPRRWFRQIASDFYKPLPAAVVTTVLAIAVAYFGLK